jgi:putative spermidine/putrescine transport system substrate-binding protein
MSKYSVSRRSFMRGTASGLAFTALGAPFGAQQAFAAKLADEELRTVGLSVTVQERILEDFKAKAGVKAVAGKGAIFPDTQTELLSGSNAYDCWETIGERLPAVIATNKIEYVPTSSLKNWGNIRDTFTKVNPKWAKKAQIAGQIWKDDKQTELWMVPTVYNYDSIGYRPDLVSKEEASTWTAIFDDKFKGKTGLNVDPLIAFGQAVLAMKFARPVECAESWQSRQEGDR